MSTRQQKHLPLGIAALAMAVVAGFFLAGREDLAEVKPEAPALVDGTANVLAVPPPPALESSLGEPTMLADPGTASPALEEQVARFARLAGSEPFDGGRAEKAMNAAALALTPADVAQLAVWVADAARGAEFRRVSLYILSRSGSAALPYLAELVRRPVPVAAAPEGSHRHPDPARTLELSLRITALEALDRSTDTRQVEPLLQSILLRQSEPSLQLMARVALSGIASGKPHRLGRMIDRMLQERVTQ